jgi:hypothetical protein
MHCLPLLLAGAALFCPSASAASPSPSKQDPSITASESRAFQLGYQLELPGASAEVFIHDVEALGNIGDESAIAPEVNDLDTEAAQLRIAEGSAYNRALILANEQGAPSDTRTWLQQRVDQLEQPVVMSSAALPYLKTQPATARIIATLDEATELRAETLDHDDSLSTWLILTSGKDALWARDTGQLCARMYVSLDKSDGLHHPTPTAMVLVSTAPSNAPLAVLRALRAIGPSPDRIAPTESLIIPPTTVESSYDTITQAFVGSEIAEQDAKVQASAATTPPAAGAN